MKVKEKLQSNLFTEEVLGKTFYGKSDGTFLEEHIKEVMDNFQNFLELYPNKFTFREQELIMKACQYHDYGKVNTLFQEFMKTGKKSSKWLQHGFFSPCFLNDRDFLNESEYEAFVTAIFYHHPRECPYFNPEKNTFIEDYKKYVKENGEKFIKKEMKNRFDLSELLFEYPNYSGIRYSILKDKENIQWILYSKIKGMLNRCDYSASAGSKTIEESPLENEKIVADIILEHYSNLRKSQEFALEHKDENIVLIAPTGSGKTEAALLWIGKEKGFYTLPLKVASTAIYHRIKDKKNYHYSKVSLLHSDALDALIDETNSKEDNTIKERYEDYQRMKRLSYPLTICTVDQIFKFPFKSLGQEQFLATLSYSKVVIDEIQMYSSRILACLLVGLSMLIKAGGKFMIITATFPDFFAHLLKEEVGVNHYIVKNCANDDTLLRHKIQFLDHDFDYEKIVESAKLKKVLVICNTISKAIDVYRNLKELNESVTKGLLHSHFIKKDRSELETRILEFKENGIWVTSPIVEASLDIDFDELYTEMCSADSLLQRFGRCYRKRAYDKKNPNIYIYETNNAYIYDKEIYKRSIDKLQHYQGNLLSEKDKITYLNEVYNISEIKETRYYKEIYKDLELMKNIYPMQYQDKEVQNLFREITNVSIIPNSVFEENDREIQKCIGIINDSNCSMEQKLIAKKELLQYTLSIRYNYKYRTDYKLIPGTELYRLPGTYTSELGFIEGEDKFENRMC